MSKMSTRELRAMVRPDMVHRRLYTDPDIFELEMERIFGRSWLFAAHESQIAKPNDFLRTYLGRHEALVTRTEDGRIHVLRNSCAHRGTQLCAFDRGNARTLNCPYHNWAFRLDGTLAAVPHPESYAPDFDLKDPGNALVRAPRVEAYRGFVFASWAPEGPSLLEHLDVMTQAIDNLVDRAPQGRIEQAGGVFQAEYRGNWKYHMENANDTIHPTFVHESSVKSAFEEDAAESIDDHQTRDMMKANGFTRRNWDGLALHATPGGHSYMGGFYSSGVIAPDRGDPASQDYRRALIAAQGEEKTDAVLGLDRFNNLIYPNVSLNAQYHQLRVVHPLAVDRTLITAFCFRLAGAPEKIFERAVRFLTAINSPASMIFTDDVEVFVRCQIALDANGRDWINIERGMQTELADADGRSHTPGASELPVRAQYAAWLRQMTAEA